ncbi:MAG: P-loop NTPase [Candidatus Aenigmarchaeota archaeon]|nr:P-loop NTPase [Candidatus Aenigmarchaeota archaeon]
MTRTIGVVSGKGGVGKTTLVSNLTHTLTDLGKSVTAIDTNVTTPHLGIHLGYHLVPKSLHDYLRGHAKINEVVYSHPHGFRLVPGSLSVNDMIGVNPDKLQSLTLNLTGKSDIILLDSAPSLGKEATLSLKLADELILLANPNLPSVLDVLKTAKVAEKLDKIILGVVVNRTKKGVGNMSAKEIESVTKYPVIGVIPEDDNVQKSLAARNAVVEFSPNSPASIEFKRIAHNLVGKKFNYSTNFWTKFLEWLK